MGSRRPWSVNPSLHPMCVYTLCVSTQGLCVHTLCVIEGHRCRCKLPRTDSGAAQNKHFFSARINKWIRIHLLILVLYKLIVYLLKFLPYFLTSYTRQASNVSWFMCWLFVCLLNFLPHFLTSFTFFFSYTFFLTYLLLYLFTSWLIYLLRPE